MSGLFITGTDTGVGKTFVTSLVARHFRGEGLDVGVMKPISTGPAAENDAVWLKKVLKLSDPLELINPIRLKHPLAPYPASKIENRKLKIGTIFQAYKKLCALHDLVLVEGIGGVMVPIKKDYLVIDLIKDFSLPTIIVARPKLGTINHTLLTIEALKKRRVNIFGIIINGYTGKDLSEKTNASVITEISGVPILTKIPWRKN
jgi:dethiobiotin synthetase